MRVLVLALLLVGVAIALPAGANQRPTCAEATVSPAPAKLHFGDPTYLWYETNGEPGIQERDCLRANGTVAPADSRTQDFWAPCWNGAGFRVCVW